MPFQPPPSRLPEVGTTIFTVMSALAQQCQAVNLGQGFPDFDCDPALVDAVSRAMRAGHNQYPPMAGVPALRDAVSAMVEACQGVRFDPADEITITAGATQGILTAILALVHPGDEVVVLEPCYDSYRPAITLAGATPVSVHLKDGGQRPDFGALRAALSPRTRMVIVNTPHNPSGAVWSDAEWDELARLLAPTQAMVLSDEVYEHMVYDGARHRSACAVPGLADRAVVISSFGKTFHVTGWKVGYVAAPRALTGEFRKVHQFNVFTVNTPAQHGLAEYLGEPSHYRSLAPFYEARRDRFRTDLGTLGFELMPCEGTYFQCVRHPRIAEMGDAAFCEWLTRTRGVAAIPLSAFYSTPVGGDTIRFCFAKRESTLDEAVRRLRGWHA